MVRRKCSITAGYDLSSERIEKLLLEASNKVEGILKEPKPYAFVTSLDNFAVEYSLYTFTNQVKKLKMIDSHLRRSVLEVFGKNEIDFTTPNLLQNVGGVNTKTKSD